MFLIYLIHLLIALENLLIKNIDYIGEDKILVINNFI